jgi:hypothetical protein
MKRREFLKDAGLAGAAVVGTGLLPDSLGRQVAAAAAPPSGRPNILIIIVDQLRTPQGAFDQALQDQAAPNLAQLRQRSVSFNSHYAAATASWRLRSAPSWITCCTRQRRSCSAAPEP